MKYLGIDYGIKRTGLAVTDPGGIMAFPRTTLHMKGKDAFFAELFAVIKAEDIEAVVIGLPLRSDGTDSETTRMVRNMAARFRRRSPLPAYFMPETLSSHQAEELLKEAGQRGRGLWHKTDEAAAVLILESFLALPPERRIPA
jgi:RNAse H-fold protein YqgF